MAGVGSGENDGFRPDLEGLRGIAVVLILLYHAGVPAVSGGFVGVDVFFVLSGYLITGILVRELRGSGTVDLLAFYARRARRILPASFLVVGVTLVLSVLVLPPVRLPDVGADVAAAAAYVPNVLFATQTIDYMDPVRTSPLLHYWSLGVEEQFYLVWPAFLLLVWRVGGRTPKRMARPLALAAAASLLLGMVWTQGSPELAFFLLPSRAWELGLGGLLALATERAPRLQRWQVSACAWVGILLIGWAAWQFDDQTAFPGIAALVPVVGSASLILAGTAGAGSLPLRLLTLSPVRTLGRISYSLYLWHWPLLALGAFALPGLPHAVRVASTIWLAVALAVLTYHLVENPLRHGQLIGTRPSLNLKTAGAISVALAVAALAVRQGPIDRFGGTSTAQPFALVGDPLERLIPGDAQPRGGPLPPDLVPRLLAADAGLLRPLPWDEGCAVDNGQTETPICPYGWASSPVTVILFGDSHARQWFAVMERIATDKGWRLLSFTKNACPYQDVPVFNRGRLFPECEPWREGALARIEAERPALVVVSGYHRHAPAVDGKPAVGDLALNAMREGAARTITRLRAMAGRVAVISDTPQLPHDATDCLSANADDILRCAVPRSSAVDQAWLEAEHAVATGLGADFIDATPWVCPTDPCPLVIGRFLVYQDTNHLTPIYTELLASRLAERLVPGQPPSP